MASPQATYSIWMSLVLVRCKKFQKSWQKKGKHEIGAVTSQERGQTITIICCMSVDGYFIPPGMIFPRKRMKAELQNGASCGTMFCCQV